MNKVKPNCGPSSVAHLIGISVEESMSKFAASNPSRYGGKRWQGYSYVSDCVDVLNDHGKIEEMTERGSLKSFVEKHTTKSGHYLLRVGGHFIAIKNQKVYDNWFDGANPLDCKWSRKRVTHAYRFTARTVEQDNFQARLERSRKAGLAITEAA